MVNDIRELVKNNIQVDVSSERLIAAATRLMNQYQDYVKKNDITETGAGEHSGIFVDKGGTRMPSGRKRRD